MSDIRNKAELFASLPPAWPDCLFPEIRSAVAANPRKIVVLDDDPTGTQTVHGLPVLTTWDVESLREEFTNELPCFYILTNTRAFPREQAEAINRDIGTNLMIASLRHDTRKDFVVISRSDSTLRGHYPAELDALSASIFQNSERPATLLVPYFEAGGRFTIHDEHYVAEGNLLIPAASTPFAKDAAFGYTTSHLPTWVEEMTSGKIPASQVVSISIDDIRIGGPERVFEILHALTEGAVCIANVACQRDLEVVAWASLQAESAGRKILYRTAASFVAARLGMDAHTLWSPPASTNTNGGLTVVGSYVPKTSAQLESLLAESGITGIEVSVDALLDSQTRAAEIERVVHLTEVSLSAGKDTVIFTSRKLFTGSEPAASLAIGSQVSAALVEIVKNLPLIPRYIIAKGGITSSDLATKALGVKRAMVLGQIIPGVPVWELGPETRFPNTPYVVFPGNVGGPDALNLATSKLNQKA